MTQTWARLEDPTQNTVISLVMVMKEKYRGYLRPILGAALRPDQPFTSQSVPRKAPHTHKEVLSWELCVPKSPLVVMSFLCPEIHLGSRLPTTRPWVDC